MDNLIIRHIEPRDNIAMAKVIRNSLEEFGAAKPGTVYFDPTTDHLFELFADTKNSSYFIVETEGKLLGGAGIFPTANLPLGHCELVKMYLSPEARGKGLGWKMIQHCLDTAKDHGFTHVYLESMHELKKAVSVYEKFGFEYLKGPLGNSGHTGCGIWMVKAI